MLPMAARRRVAVLRQPRPSARVARALWIALAVIVWNVVFDRVIVVSGRTYVAAATQVAAGPRGPFANMDDWMRPAVTRGLWIATAAGAVVFATGLIAVSQATRRSAGLREPQGIPSVSRDESLARQDHPR
jgi:hypothetical protein